MNNIVVVKSEENILEINYDELDLDGNPLIVEIQDIDDLDQRYNIKKESNI
jgi:hypothetical protein